MGVVVLALRGYRESAMSKYGSNDAAVKWQTWRSAADEMGRGGPVHREKPASSEPPPLVLMRDHFAACLGISLLISSCLFMWFMISARGAMRPAVLHDDDD
jgi:hypothetical protein